MDGAVGWANLPKELLEAIAKLLGTGVDVLRLRAVCTSWRYSVPLLQKPPRPPIRLPFPINPTDYRPRIDGRAYFELTESTVYRLEPLEKDTNSSSSGFTRKGWLVKLEPSDGGKMKILNPLSERQIHHRPGRFPKVLNLLQFRASELCKAYNLQYVNPSNPPSPFFIQIYATKVVVSPLNAVVAIDNGGQLWNFKSGDKSWTMLSKQNRGYIDIISYKNGFCATDKTGKTVMFDPSFKETQISSRVHSDGRKKHLVESNGELFLVDVVLDTDPRTNPQTQNGGYPDHNDPEPSPRFHTAVEIKLYQLNDKKHKWEEVKRLENQALFVGEDCSFFISYVNFSGFKENCVYFTDRHYFQQAEHDDELVEVLRGHNIGVCDLEEGRLGPLALFREYANIFWPPPCWLMPTDARFEQLS